jgi:outer membrane murein-binding lipoprotein Lpp
MLRATCAAALISATLLSGCSSRRTFDDEKLKSAATETVSIAAEGELFATSAGETRLAANYIKGHPEYLRKEAEDVVKELREGRPEAKLQDRFDRLRLAAARLMEILNALPPTAGDPRWQQSRSQLNEIRLEAQEIRRTF